MVMCLVWFFLADQRLDLNKLGPNDNDTVRGQIVGKKHNFSYITIEKVIILMSKASQAKNILYMCIVLHIPDALVYTQCAIILLKKS